MLLLLLLPSCMLDTWEQFVFPFRDGQSGKVTVDDYGARTGKSPGKMRQLNINGDLYVGECSPFLFRTHVHFCLRGWLQGRAPQLHPPQGEVFMCQPLVLHSLVFVWRPLWVGWGQLPWEGSSTMGRTVVGTHRNRKSHLQTLHLSGNLGTSLFSS